MQTTTTIGLDIAKSVFQVHGVDAIGEMVIRRQLKRRHVLAFLQKPPPCLVGIQACASSHHWSRENRVTAICAACSWPVHWLVRYAKIHGAKHRPPGSRRYWRGARRRSPAETSSLYHGLTAGERAVP
jgi:hypothetical protein